MIIVIIIILIIIAVIIIFIQDNPVSVTSNSIKGGPVIRVRT